MSPMPPQRAKTVQSASLPIVSDELAWELLRDEWELLLAVGNGPTSVERVASGLGLDATSHEDLQERLQLLASHGVVYAHNGAFGLVSALHVRQEGMASFLKDLVIKRLQLGKEEPFAVGYRHLMGPATSSTNGMRPILAAAETRLFPGVFEALQAPALGDHRQAVTFIFAVASDLGDVEVSNDLDGFMAVLRAAARERSSELTREGADLKLADTRNDMADVQRVAHLCEQFLAGTPETSGSGAVAYAVLLRPISCADSGDARGDES